MTTTQELYTQSLLAQAAYANLHIGTPDKNSLERDAGMATAQAADFAIKWTVVDLYSDASGVGATVFQEIATGTKYLAIRGTEGLGDFNADYILATGIPSFLNPQYIQLSAAIDGWLSSGVLPNNFTVTGHSLGGYLAAALGSFYSANTSHVYTYNAPGLGGITGNAIDALRATFSLSDTALVSDITNVRGTAGISLITGLGAQLAPPLMIETELNANPLNNHSIVNLTDSLAVQNTLATLDTTASTATLNSIIKSSGNVETEEQENTLDALRKLLGNTETTPIGDRETLWANMVDLQNSTSFQSLIGKVTLSTPATSASEARNDFGAFLSLIYLTPFALKANDIAAAVLLETLNLTNIELALKWEQDNTLTPEQLAGGEANYSDLWLADRAAMLSWQNKLNALDIDATAMTPYIANTASQHFKDIASGKEIFINGLVVESQDFIFGSSTQADVITGHNKNDHLYGLDGNDTLSGGLSNDWLEGCLDDDHLDGGKGNDTLFGGLGDDTYIYQAGDGFDTILDTGGAGKILWDSLEIKGSIGIDPTKWQKLSDTFWKDETNSITYSLKTQADGSNTLFIGRKGDELRVDKWLAGNLGITLGAASAPPPAAHIYNGDQRAPLIGIEIDLATPSTDADFNTYKWSATSWAADGTLSNGVVEANFNDVIYGDQQSVSDEDTINGFGGNDALDGRAGDDQIDGGEGDDLIAGGAGSDIIYGGAGNDEVLSATGLNVPQRKGPGDVWLVPSGKTLWTMGSTWGVAGNADNTYTIYGGGSLIQDAAPDVVFAGEGDDRVVGGLGDDYIDGGLDNDTLTGHGGNDLIDGGDGNDYIQGDGINKQGSYWTLAEANHGNDTLDGGAGADTIVGGGKNDVLFGGSGNDLLWGDDSNETNLTGQYHGNDYLDGGDGNDQLVGGGKDDTLIGGIGNDYLWGDDKTETNLAGQNHGNDYLDGGDGNDQLVGGGKDDTLIGGAGNDMLFGDVTVNNLAVEYHGNDYLDGGEGDDYLDGGSGDDVLSGGAGIDSLHGGDGNDYLDGGEGDDLSSGNGNTAGDGGLVGGAGDDTIYGGAGMDELDGGDGLDLLDGGTGDDLLFGGAGDDSLLGGEGNDQLQGGDDNDVLDGGAGNDLLFGEAGNDTLDGGAGADQLQGGAGDDTYINITGEDTIIDTEGHNIIRLAQANSVGAGGLTVTNSGDQGQYRRLDIALDDGETLKIQNAFFGTDATLEFANGDQLDLETLVGTSLSTALNLQLGDSGGKLYGGAGNDILYGGSGADVLNGALGDDMLYGGVGNDTLNGGIGNDTLVGGTGKDTYIFNRGGRRDTIIDSEKDSNLIFGEGITASDITLRLGLLELDLGNGDQVHIDGFDLNDAFNSSSVNYFTFADGLQLSIEQLLARGFDLDGTNQNDSITGTNTTDRINGLAGNDLLSGGAGNDTLDGGDGNDIVNGGANDDILIGGAGRDLLLGGVGNDVYQLDASSDTDEIADIQGQNVIRFAADITLANLSAAVSTLGGQSALLIKVNGVDAATITYGWGNFSFEFADGARMTQAEFLLNFRGQPQTVYGDGTDNTLYGGKASDTLYGQGGNDTLWGGAGDDLLEGGLGSDDYRYRLGDGHDVIQETDDPNAGQSSLDQVTFGAGIGLSDVSFNHQANGDLSLTVAGLADAITVTGWYANPEQRVEAFVFADGQQVTADTLAALDVTPLQGTAGNDRLSGTDYRDIIMAGSGDDLLIGNGGNDDLHGETGTDTYRLSQGSGADQVFEVEGETSVIEVTNYDLSRLTGTRVGDDLLLGVTDAGDSMTLKNFYTLNHDWQVKGQTNVSHELAGLLANNEAYRASRSEVECLQESFIANSQDTIIQGFKAQGMVQQADGSWQSPFQLSAIQQTTNFVRASGYSGYVPQGSSYAYFNTSSISVGTYSISAYSSDAAEINYSGGASYTNALKNVQVAWGTPQTSTTSEIYSTWSGHYLYTTEEALALMDSLGVSGIQNPYVYTGMPAYIHTVTTTRQVATALSIKPADGTGYDINGADPKSFFQLVTFPSTLSVVTLEIDANIDIVSGGDSDNTIEFTGYFGIVHGGAGNDTLTAYHSSDLVVVGEQSLVGQILLDGGLGDDLIVGSIFPLYRNNDIIVGGPGNDVLEGSVGNDRYYFLAGDTGIDLVYDTSINWPIESSNDNDYIVFGKGINLSDFTFSWESASLQSHVPDNYGETKLVQLLNISWHPDTVVKIAMPREDEHWWNKTGIEFFEFADGSRMTMEQMLVLAGPSPEHAPVINTPFEDQTVTKDMPFSFTIPIDVMVDQDAGDVLSYDYYSSYDRDGSKYDYYPNWLYFDYDTQTFSGTPVIDGIGSLEITVTASDRFGASVSDTFTLTVNPINKVIGTTGNDTLLGTAAADELIGLSGSDMLDGGLGADMLIGGQGDDRLYGGAGSDYYRFGLGSGADTIIDRTITGSGDINTVAMGEGVFPENIVVTSDGNHIILSIAGTSDKLSIQWDRQNGYLVQQVVFPDGTVWDAAALESMSIPLNTAPTLTNPISDQNGVENHPFSFQISSDTFHDTDSGDVLNYTAMRADGSPLPAWLSFNAATRTFVGTPGLNDAGTFSLIVTATDQGGLSSNSTFNLNIANLIEATVYNDSIVGSAGNDYVSTGAGNDTVNGGDGNDVIIGGTGSDLLAGGAGDDSFLIAGNDTGYDRFQGDAGLDLILGDTGDDVIRVNNFSGIYTVEKIDGGLGTNTLAGTQYNDTIDLSGTELVNIASIDGGLRNDTLTGSAGNDVIVGGIGSDLLAGGAGDDSFLIAGNDTGYDRFQGDAGLDMIQGGAGDDVIRVNNFSGIYTVEKIDGGLGTNILAGTQYNDIIDLSGTELANIASIDGGLGNDTITGSVGNDVIIGGTGSDLLAGGAGDDTFLIAGNDSGYDRFKGDAGFDLIQGGAGDDVIRVNNFSGAYTVEKIDGGLGTNTLAGTQYNDIIDLSGTELANIASIDGGLGNDTITGSAGNDVIIGSTGSDLLAGGAGDDIFLMSGSDTGYDRFQGDAGLDLIQGGAGDDVIRVNNFSGAYTVEKIDGGLGNNVVAGTQYNDTIDLSGTELVNTASIDGGLGNDALIGSAGNDVIIGGIGSDRLAGGAGDDIFLMSGNDTGYDRFQGDAGLDLIQGGAGDDVIRVNNFSGAYTVEKIDGGLGANILAGTQYNDTIDLSATELVNIASIEGGAGNDKLIGSYSSDMLDGGAGNDTLIGGHGNDTYRFGAGSGADLIQENDSTVGNTDVLAIAAGIDSSQLWFRHIGNDLEMSVIGTADKATVKDWYLGTANHVEQFKTTDGAKMLIDSNVQNLVNAMAAFAPPAAGQSTLPQNYQTALAPVIAANWQ